jgi:hypothetical protein
MLLDKRVFFSQPGDGRELLAQLIPFVANRDLCLYCGFSSIIEASCIPIVCKPYCWSHLSHSYTIKIYPESRHKRFRDIAGRAHLPGLLRVR